MSPLNLHHGFPIHYQVSTVRSFKIWPHQHLKLHSEHTHINTDLSFFEYNMPFFFFLYTVNYQNLGLLSTWGNPTSHLSTNTALCISLSKIVLFLEEINHFPLCNIQFMVSLSFVLKRTPLSISLSPWLDNIKPKYCLNHFHWHTIAKPPNHCKRIKYIFQIH